MEVHHPHHPTHKKKWSEYIIEFVMLFTAVTLGFFAENIRESIAEQHKKKETLESVAIDFEKDIKQLEFHKNFDLDKIKICDSLDSLIDINPEKIDQKLYYRLINNYYMSWKFNSNNRSRIESEAKGYFSNENNSELATYISKYTFHLTDYNDNTVIEQENYMNFYKNENMRRFVDVSLQRVASRYPRVDIESKLGIKPISAESKEILRFYLNGTRVFNDIGLYNIDSLQFYANKAIAIIRKEK